MEDEGAEEELRNKIAVLRAFFELAWADGSIADSEARYISELGEEMNIPLGQLIPLLAQGFTIPPKERLENLGDYLLDNDERYLVAEKLVALCFITEELSFKQTQTLASLAVQLNITAEQLEEIRLRVC